MLKLTEVCSLHIWGREKGGQQAVPMPKWVEAVEICHPSFFGDLSHSRKYFWMLWEPSEGREWGRLARWGWDEVERNFGNIWRSSGRLAVGVACESALFLGASAKWRWCWWWEAGKQVGEGRGHGGTPRCFWLQFLCWGCTGPVKSP